MNLQLRRGTRAGTISAEQHDALMAAAPDPSSGEDEPFRLSPESAMVLSIYNEMGGAPLVGGMMGLVDRRAEVSLPRMALARASHPGVAPEFFRGLFAYMDGEHLKRANEAQAKAAEARKNG